MINQQQNGQNNRYQQPKQYQQIVSQQLQKPLRSSQSSQQQQLNQANKKNKKRSNISIQQAQQFVKAHIPQIKPSQWIRNNYYQKLGLDQYTRHRQQHLQKQQSYSNQSYHIDIFTAKTSQQIRNRYLSKLNIFTNNISEQQNNQRKRHQHFFIFDWDDTILCTSYLSSVKFIDISNDAKNLLKKLDDTSKILIEKVIEKGKVYIITNAVKGWVEYSSKLYLPKTHELVINSKIKICSARSMFGQEYPGDFGRWKMQAFKTILKNVDRYLVTNLICVGDSNIQMEAAHCVGKEFYHGLIKTVKFRQNPKIDQLIKQQELVNSKLIQIFDSQRERENERERANEIQRKEKRQMFQKILKIVKFMENNVQNNQN